jgi:hypothetical protein
LQFVGFYGGKDSLVPQSTAEPLQKILGSRYTHVVHPAAGHVSYLFTPSAWESHDVRALLPNPVDVLLEASSRAGARADKD